MNVLMNLARDKPDRPRQNTKNADCADEDIHNRLGHYRSLPGFVLADFAGEETRVTSWQKAATGQKDSYLASSCRQRGEYSSIC